MMKERIGYEEIRDTALRFVDAMKVGPEIGSYKKDPTEEHSSWYGSYHAAHILDMYGKLDEFSSEEIDTWAEYINQKQCDQGYFSNKEIDLKRTRSIDELDPIWHFTRGMLWTLRVLRRKPKNPLTFIEPLLDKKVLYNYIKKYDWGNSWAAGNQICALATALYAYRDFHNDSSIDKLLEDAMFPALEELLDPATGYWGTDKGASLVNGQFGTIHVLPMYFAQGWEYRFLERSVDSTIETQLADGSFWPCGSECPDFDGAYMLYNLYQLTDYRKEDMQEAADKYLDHTLLHIAEDGVGFLMHRRDCTPDQWVSRPHFVWEEGKSTATEEYRDEDASRLQIMLDSWFYPLSIAIANEISSDPSRFKGEYRLTKMSLHECNVTNQFVHE